MHRWVHQNARSSRDTSGMTEFLPLQIGQVTFGQIADASRILGIDACDLALILMKARRDGI